MQQSLLGGQPFSYYTEGAQIFYLAASIQELDEGRRMGVPLYN